MTRTLKILVIFAMACTSKMKQTLPLGVSLLPPELDIEKILPPVPASEASCNESAPKFDPEPVLGGTLTRNGKTKELPSGVLVSECTFAQENVADQSELNRTRKELQLIKNLRSAEHKAIREAEEKYQQRIKALQDELQPGFIERNRFEFGIIAGIVLTTLVVYAVNQAQ